MKHLGKVMSSAGDPEYAGFLIISEEQPFLAGVNGRAWIKDNG